MCTWTAQLMDIHILVHWRTISQQWWKWRYTKPYLLSAFWCVCPKRKRLEHVLFEILGFFMFMVKWCIYLCMYLLQVVSRPPQLGIESDLFRCVQLAKEVQFYFKIESKSCLIINQNNKIIFILIIILSLGSVNAHYCRTSIIFNPCHCLCSYDKKSYRCIFWFLLL